MLLHFKRLRFNELYSSTVLTKKQVFFLDFVTLFHSLHILNGEKFHGVQTYGL